MLRILFVLGGIEAFLEGENFLLEVFSTGRDFSRGGNSQGRADLPGEILHWVYLPEFLYEILFSCLTFCLPNRFYLWRWLWALSGGNFTGLELSKVSYCRGDFPREKFSLEEFSVDIFLHWGFFCRKKKLPTKEDLQEKFSSEGGG